MDLEDLDREVLKGAIDTLALALTCHGHYWTDGERTIYEQALAILGEPVEPEDDPG